MHSLTEENYLKALYLLDSEKNEISVNEISKRLGTKMSTVNSMVKKLAAKKLVFYQSYKPLRLTEKGKREAALIIRKHRLTEMFLVEKMGFGWEEVHHIAEQIEHLDSPVFFERMDKLLGFPTIDPHGSPIPSKSGKVEWPGYNKLSDCKKGAVAKLAAVINTEDEFLMFLNKRHLKLGVNITVNAVEIFDGSMTVSYADHKKETLSHTVCERLLVEKV